MATVDPDYAEANARFAKLSAASSSADPYAMGEQAASRWAAQQDARRPVVEGPSAAEQHLSFLKVANDNAVNAGLPPINMADAEARVAAEKQTQATEASRATAVASHMPGEVPQPGLNVNSLPPAPPLPNPDGIIDPNNLTASQLASFGYASVDPRTVALGQDAFNSSMAGIKREQAALLDSTNNIAQAEKEAQASLAKQLDLDVSRNSAMSSVTSQATEAAAQREQIVKQLVAESSAETQAQMLRVRQTADEAANAQIKDFWADKTTGGRILGIISQALAGAANGLSGQPGASTPLDKVMAADLERQRINLNQKTTTSYREQGILGLMRQNFSSQLEAGAAAYGAAINHVDMLAKDVAQRYKTPEAMAKYEEFHAQNIVKYNQAMAAAHNAILGSEIQKAQLSSTMISRLSSANAAASGSANKGANAQKTGLHIIGLKGDVSKPVYQALHKQAAAIGSVIGSYEKIEELTKDGVQYNENWRRQVNQYASEIFAATRTRYDTGKRLEGDEKAQVMTAVPQITSAMLSEMTPAKLFDFKKSVKNQLATTVQAWTGHAKAVAGNDYDLEDPQIGPYIRANARAAQGQ